MTPWQKAEQWHNEHDATISFAELVGEHMSTGLVHSSPSVFVLMGEVRWNAEEKQFEAGEPNCWFVRLAAAVNHANPVYEYMRVASHPHKYAAWFRRGGNEPRVYDWDKLMKKVGGH